MAPDTLPAEPVADDIDDNAIIPLGDTPELRVSGRIRTALELLVYDGVPLEEAADRSGLKRSSLRAMLGMPKYAAVQSAMVKVLRTAERARNIRRLAEIRDQNRNLAAAVAAARTIEQIDQAAPSVVVNINPGWVIDMSSVAPGRMIEHHPGNGPNPLIEHEVVPADARGTRRDEADDG